jgi:hypothetical protein
MTYYSYKYHNICFFLTGTPVPAQQPSPCIGGTPAPPTAGTPNLAPLKKKKKKKTTHTYIGKPFEGKKSIIAVGQIVQLWSHLGPWHPANPVTTHVVTQVLDATGDAQICPFACWSPETPFRMLPLQSNISDVVMGNRVLAYDMDKIEVTVGKLTIQEAMNHLKAWQTSVYAEDKKRVAIQALQYFLQTGSRGSSFANLLLNQRAGDLAAELLSENPAYRDLLKPELLKPKGQRSEKPKGTHFYGNLEREIMRQQRAALNKYATRMSRTQKDKTSGAFISIQDSTSDDEQDLLFQYDDEKCLDDETPVPKPVCTATLLDSSTLGSGVAVYTMIQSAMHHAIGNGQLLRWSDAMCHYDSVLALTLASYYVLGSTYWDKNSSTTVERRDVSTSEKWTLDLLMSSNTTTEVDMMQLRNAIMWQALTPGTYGKCVDAMVHPFYAGDGELDAYHAMQRTVEYEDSVPCQCLSTREVHKTSGCVLLLRDSHYKGKKSSLKEIEAATLAGFQANIECTIKCRQELKRADKQSAKEVCPGETVMKLKELKLGPLLVCALEPGVGHKLALTMALGGHRYDLVGVCIHVPGHYVSRWRTGLGADALWYDYDDCGGKRRVTRFEGSVLKQPQTVGGRKGTVRGAWYVNVGCSEPVVLAL